MIILVLQYWTSLNPHHVLMSLWWRCALQLPPTHTLYRQTGTRADAAAMKTDHCGLNMSSLSCDAGVNRECACVWVCVYETQNVYLSLDACLLLECMSFCICIIMCLLCLWMCVCVHVNMHLCNHLQGSLMPAQLCPWINNLYLNVYALQMCLCVCVVHVRVCVRALLISQTAPEAPDGWPSIRLSVSQERTPQAGENMMLWPWGAEGLEVWISLHCFTPYTERRF